MISLGIDIGGTGCKCVAFRDTGEQIAMSYRCLLYTSDAADD